MGRISNKYLIIALLSVFLCSSIAYSQGNRRGHSSYSTKKKKEAFVIKPSFYRIGAKLGMGQTELTGGDMQIGAVSNAGSALDIGFFYYYQISRVMAIQPELNFMIRNSCLRTPVDVYDSRNGFYKAKVEVENDWHISFLEIPILFKYEAPRSNPKNKQTLDIFFEAGFSFALRLNTDRETIIGIPDDLKYGEYTLNSYEQGYGEVRMLIGVGGEIKLKKGYLTPQMRFSAGMTNVGKNHDRLNTSTIMFQLGYSLPVKRMVH